jgi:hypothetical protein
MDMNLKQKLLKEVYSVVNATNSGTHNFKTVRRNFLKRLVKDILDLRLDLKSFYFFNNGHLDKLIAYWSGLDNSISTIINKRSMLEWFLKMLDSDVILTKASEFNLKRNISSKKNVYITERLIHEVYHPISRTILDFQLYFGLTKYESIKIDAYSCTKHALKISQKLAFNSNEREILAVTANQKQAIKDRLNLLQEKSSLLDVLSLRNLVKLYDQELLINGIASKTDLRKFYIQQHLVHLQNMKYGKKEIYKRLMERTGFKKIDSLLRLVYS